MRTKKARAPKLPAGITQEFIDTVDAASSDDKKAMIVRMQKDLDEAQTFLKSKEEIVDLREQLKLLEGPSRDTIKAIKNKTKHVIDALNQQGAI